MRHCLIDAEQIVESLSGTLSIEDIRCLLNELRDSLGFANIAYHAVYLPYAADPNPLVVVTYDPNWECRYIERNYFRIDPVVAMAVKRSLPVDWSSVDHASEKAKRIFAEADSFGVGKNGVTIPIRCQGGERALLSITSNLSRREWGENRIKILCEFHYISHLLHHRVVQISGLRPKDTSHSLSPRELECTQLTAQGLTPKQIAGLLHISASAVRIYLNGARLKLGCATVDEAIGKAVCLEIVTPQSSK